MTGEIRVRSLDFDPVDAGYTILPNYTARFWFPMLRSSSAIGLYLILMVHADQQGHAWPSIATIADTLAVDRRTITGRTQDVDGKPRRYPGAIETLERHGLLRTDRVEPDDGNPFWNFYVRKRPPILTPAQVDELPERLQHAHDRWLKRWVEGGGTHHPGGWHTPPRGVAHTTRTRTIEEDPLNKIPKGKVDETSQEPTTAPWSVQQTWPTVAGILAQMVRPEQREQVARALDTLRPVALADTTLTLRGPRASVHTLADHNRSFNANAPAAFDGIADVHRIQILGFTDD